MFHWMLQMCVSLNARISTDGIIGHWLIPKQWLVLLLYCAICEKVKCINQSYGMITKWNFMFSGIPTHHIAYIYGDPKKVGVPASSEGNKILYYYTIGVVLWFNAEYVIAVYPACCVTIMQKIDNILCGTSRAKIIANNKTFLISWMCLYWKTSLTKIIN